MRPDGRMTTISLVHDALLRGRGDIRAAAVLLDEAASSARSRVRSLESSWHGLAAGTFLAAFGEWDEAAAGCLGDLRRLAEELAAAHALFTAADDAAAVAAGALLAGAAS